MNSENRNLILAIALSMAVLFGWQVFIVGPELERETARQQAIAEQMAASDAESRDTLAATTQGTAAMPAIATDEATAVADAPRITIDAPLVSGSISLAGLRFDDVVLKGYQKRRKKIRQISSCCNGQIRHFPISWSSAGPRTAITWRFLMAGPSGRRTASL